MTEEEKQIQAELETEENVDIVDFSKVQKKKKKKKKKKEENTEEVKTQEQADAFDLNKVPGHVNYEYSFMLDRIEEIHFKNQGKEDASTDKEEMPKTGYISTRTNWANFESIRAKIDRPAFHVLNYFKTELDVEGVIHPDGNLILSGKYQNKNITALYKQYLNEFVRCLNCKSLRTSMDKDKNTRLQTLSCLDCGATRNLSKITQRFHAVKRGERRAARQAK